MQKSCIPYIAYQSLLLSTIVLNDSEFRIIQEHMNEVDCGIKM